MKVGQYNFILEFLLGQTRTPYLSRGHATKIYSLLSQTRNQQYSGKFGNYISNCNFTFVTRHAKRYELGGRRHSEKIRLKVNVASRKNSTPKRVSKRSLTSYKTGSKAFFKLRFSANRLSNTLYDIKCSLLNVRKLKLGRESSTQFSL